MTDAINSVAMQPVCSTAFWPISGRDGLRGLLRSYEDRELDVTIDDLFICMDADSRQDLAELRSRYRCDNR